jgi:hypothetical protein
MTTTKRIEHLDVNDLTTGKSRVPQPLNLTSPNAPPLPTNAFTLHARLTRTFTELRWLRSGSPACADFFFTSEADALRDARGAARLLVLALEAL